MTTRREFLVTCAALLVLPMAARAGSWVVLGQRRVRLGADHDRIAVNARGGPYSKLRLEVARNGILIDAVRVTFANGDLARFELRNFIERGGRTRDIDLPGGARDIRYIDLVYARRPGGGVAVVTALGLDA